MDVAALLHLVPQPFRLVAKHLLDRLDSMEKRLQDLEQGRSKP